MKKLNTRIRVREWPACRTVCKDPKQAMAFKPAQKGKVMCWSDEGIQMAHKCPSCDGSGCPTCDPQTRTVRVLFSIEVEVPAKNPNTMKEGPGPVLFDFLDDTVQNTLSDAPGCLNEEECPWLKDIGDFKLHAVEEVPRYR